MDQISITSRRPGHRAADALGPLARIPPIRWVISALTAVHDAAARVIDILEMGNLIEEINEYSLRRALRAVGVEAFMRITVESPSELP